MVLKRCSKYALMQFFHCLSFITLKQEILLILKSIIMKYLNKNIEEIGKRANAKSLVNRSELWTLFKKYNSKNASLDNYTQGYETY